MSELSLDGSLCVALDIAALCVLTWIPLRRRFHQDDAGDGITHVVLPRRPVSVKIWRGLGFLFVGLVSSLLIIGYNHFLTHLYRQVLLQMAGWALAQPQDAVPVVSDATPQLALLAGTYFVCLGATVRATVARRLRIAMHGVLLVLLIMSVDILLTIVGAATSSSIAPGPLPEAVCVLVIGFVVFVRMTFVCFMLPLPSRQMNTRPRYLGDRCMMALALCVGAALITILLAVLEQSSQRGTRSALILSFFVFSSFFTPIAVVLFSSKWLARKPPPMLEPPPPINVIVAAFNEQDIITANLESIERAAEIYGGPVHVVVANDGSTDATVAVCEAAFRRYRFATGEVVSRVNGGIARAYNTALEAATSEYIVRIDADTLIHEDALRYAVRWLQDPHVGQVSALYLPRTDLPESWFHRMRLLECLFGFGFARQGHAVVDGVVCAPGPLAAYRRSVAFEVGGYTVGMNGEDLDFTNKVGRAGYRVILDSKVIAFEDVPHGFQEFRGQRNRWSRAGIHSFARYAPFCTSPAGPRTWFMFPRLFSTRFTGPLRLLVIIHAIMISIFEPSYRDTIVIVGSLYLLASLPTFTLALVLLIRYGFYRKIPWLVMWYPYLIVRRYMVLEGLLSLPTRPVSVRGPLTRLARSLGLPHYTFPDATARGRLTPKWRP